jgi:hypothetical protein
MRDHTTRTFDVDRREVAHKIAEMGGIADRP